MNNTGSCTMYCETATLDQEKKMNRRNATQTAPVHRAERVSSLPAASATETAQLSMNLEGNWKERFKNALTQMA
jgi:hypothetical protein